MEEEKPAGLRAIVSAACVFEGGAFGESAQRRSRAGWAQGAGMIASVAALAGRPLVFMRANATPARAFCCKAAV